MKAITYKKLLITLIALGCRIISSGQQYPDSLLWYLEIASKNNPVVLQRFSEYEASLQKIPQVGSLPDPELSAGVFLSPMELVNGNQVADLRLMQMFPWFGVLRSARDEMSLMAKAKFELLRDAKNQVCYDVQRTWYQLYLIRKKISISEKNAEILKIIERLALVKYRSVSTESSEVKSSASSEPSMPDQIAGGNSSGMRTMPGGQNSSGNVIQDQASQMENSSMGSSDGNLSLAEIYGLQIEAGDLENNIALLKSQQNSIIAKFNTYLNRPVNSPVHTSENITLDFHEFALPAVSDSMLARNPMLGMLDFEKQSLESRKQMVNRMGYPMVGLGLNYSLINKSNFSLGEPSMNGKDMIMPMVVLTLPIYRRKYTAMQKEAELLKEAASENWQATANSLQSEYYEAILLYEDAQRRVKLYENQFRLASKSLDLLLKNFTTSSSGLTDVLRIRQQTLDFELRQVEAVADFNTALAWLRRLGDIDIN